MSGKEPWNDIDAFVAWYKETIPDENYFITNRFRFEAIFRSIQEISRIIIELSPDAKIAIRHADFNPTSFYYEVIADELSSSNITKLCSALSIASNIDVHPVTCGKNAGNLSFSVLFDGVYSPRSDS